MTIRYFSIILYYIPPSNFTLKEGKMGCKKTDLNMTFAGVVLKDSMEHNHLKRFNNQKMRLKRWLL